MKTVSAIKQTPLVNLEKWISQNGVERKVETLAYQIPHGMAKGLKLKAEAGRHLPGTFFKIVDNTPSHSLRS